MTSARTLPLHGLASAAREVSAMARRRRPESPGRRDAACALAAVGPAGHGWALVTGGSSGIGLAFAEALAARGARLLLTAEDEAGLKAAQDAVLAAGATGCEVVVADLSEPDGVADLLTQAGRHQVDLLVNNAGVGVKGRFTVPPAAAYSETIAVDALAPVLLTRALLPPMLERGRGAVVHVASINALAPMPGSAVYSATKAFVLSYGTALWAEHQGRGVAFQVLLPGTTKTAFHDRQGTRVPPWAMEPADVVASSLAALGGPPVHVPGRVNRVLRRLGAALPLELRTVAAGAVMTASLGPVDQGEG